MKSFNQINKIAYLGMLLFVLLCGCKKGWLDAKPEKALKVPNTIRDFQALLDNAHSSAITSFNSKIGLYSEISAGDFFNTDAEFATNSQTDKNLYIWEPDIYKNADPSSGQWNDCYSRIFYTNAILEGIEKITPTNNAEQVDWSQVKGSALLFRALNHFVITQEFCKPFDKSTAGSDLGIPVRLSSDPNIASTRGTVGATYDQIISDLKQAYAVLPVSIPNSNLYKLRPTKTAATALLARVYLSMGVYDSAYKYADKTLQQYSNVMDFNLQPPLLPSGTFRIPRFNPEVILHLESAAHLSLSLTKKKPSLAFVNSYNPDDLRKSIFWFLNVSNYLFVGNYNNNMSGQLFCGLATDEIYLIRAECLARAGNKDAALLDLNFLLQKRWKNTVTYPTISAVDANDALVKILTERRKELIYRGIRWSDLRRLNKEPQFAVTLTRTVNGTTYNLPPNSPLYVLPIPPDVIALTGMPQNPR